MLGAEWFSLKRDRQRAYFRTLIYTARKLLPLVLLGVVNN